MRSVSRVAACVFLIAVAAVSGLGHETDHQCDLVNNSRSLDEFKQHWNVHCVGIREFEGERWSVEGRLVCAALQSILLPFPTPTLVRGGHGTQQYLVVEFWGACIWCPFIYAASIAGPPAANGVCRCCTGLWPCADGKSDPFPEVRRSRYVPTISVDARHSARRDSLHVIEIAVNDRDGDLRLVYWSDPRHGTLVGPSRIVPEGTYNHTLLLYYSPQTCWTGRDSFTVTAVDAGGLVASKTVGDSGHRYATPA